MKNIPGFALFSFFILLAGGLNLHAAHAAPDLAGHWKGIIVLPKFPTDIEVDFLRKADLSWQGTLTYPARGVHGLELNPVTVDGSAITFTLSGSSETAQFVGRLIDDSKTISGDFTEGNQKLPFKLARVATKDPAAIARKLVGAAGAGDIGTLKKMLGQGADINCRTPEGLTPLFNARIKGQKEAYDFLLSKGADANAPLPAPEALVDALFTRSFDQDGAGAAVLVARNGKILFEKGYGLADIEQKAPVTTATKFRIGSITKQFTSASILRLQEAGKLQVTDPLARYYPEFPRGNEVVLQRLLTHTSGIHNYTEEPDFRANVMKPVAPATLLASIEKFPCDFNPGAKWNYSNSNYIILGDIVEKVSGQNYGDFLKQTFFDPLGMTATGVYHNETPPADAAMGYSYDNGRYEKALDWDMSWAGGAGSLYSTVEDLYRWSEGIFGHKVLNDASLAAAFTPIVTEENKNENHADGYGFGWMISLFRGAREISHGGVVDGFVTNLLRLPDQNFTVVVLTNSHQQKPGTNPEELSRNIVEFYLGAELAARPVEAVNTSVPSAALAAIVGRYDFHGKAMVITREDRRVFAQLSPNPRVEIFPKSETEFFYKAVEAQLIFIKDANGKVVSAAHHQDGIIRRMPRLQDEVEIKLPSTALAAIVGRYDYGRAILVVTQEGDRGFAQLGLQPRFEIFPKSDTEFFSKADSAQLTFVKDADGKVVSLINHQNGHTINAPRLEDIVETKLDEAHSAPILGEYTVGPDTTVTISRETGRLYTQRTGQSKLELVAKSDTEFFVKLVNVQLTFVKDANGNVTSLIHHQNGKTHEWQKVKQSIP